MAFPSDPFKTNGGCNCGAYRFAVSIPARPDRPENPYRITGSTVEGDPHLPMVVIDHCNDCRRATGALLPIAMVTVTSWTTTTNLVKDSSPAQHVTLPASELFDHTSISSRNFHLSVYKSSPGRSRWFCSRCGTSLAYTIDDGAIPKEWNWPKMLDIWLGSVDREDLENEYMKPERQLWCDKGIPWIRDFARRAGDGIPEHPTTKINEIIEMRKSIADVLEADRKRLKRVEPEEALDEVRSQSMEKPVLLVDIRPAAQREKEGMIEGALVVERNVLEWRFDPQSNAKLPVASSYDLRIIVFCQESYTSSLAAKALQELGLRRATDMAGGYKAWRDNGLPDKI